MIQLQMLNKILDTKDSSIITMNNLNNDYFSDYKDEFNYIKNHFNLYGSICDKETFLNKFPNFELINVTEPFQYLLKELYNDYNTRKLAESFNQIRSLLMNNKIDDAMLEYKNIQNKLASGIAFTCIDITKDTSRYNDYIERCKDFNKFYVTTGFKELDNVIGGWDREEDYVTIIARPGIGKSWLLLKFALAAVQQGLNVGLYSGEMSERMVGYRFDTLESHISNGSMIHGNDNIQLEYKKYMENLNTRFKGSLKILTPAMINGSANVDALRAFIEKEKLDILFVDQHSLLDDVHKAKNPIDRAANISKDIKVLQSIKKIPIITASQQNRVKNENGPGTDNISQSDRIGQDSSIVLALEKNDDIFKITLVKSRFSTQGASLSYVVDLNLGNFKYIPDDEDANKGQSEDDYESRYGEDVF